MTDVSGVNVGALLTHLDRVVDQLGYVTWPTNEDKESDPSVKQARAALSQLRVGFGCADELPAAYQVAFGISHSDVEFEVRRLMGAGWQLQGGVCVGVEGHLYQALTKRGDQHAQ
jgi:hypothetical protein